MNGIVILDRANVPLGPFTREQVEAKLQRGEVTLGSLAFVEGLAQWTPLGEVLAQVEATPSLPPAAPPLPAVPRVPVVGPAHVVVPPPAIAAPKYSYAATMEAPSHLVYAGFWLRVAAHLIDLVLLSVVIVGVIFVVVVAASAIYALPNSHHLFSESVEEDPTAVLVALLLEIVLCIVCFVIVWLYHAMLESSSWQGTVGKRVLNLQITSLSGERIGFWHATARFLARTFASFPFGIGLIMVAFTERRQALHDMIASTLVVRG